MASGVITRVLDFLIYANVYVAFPVTLIASSTYLLSSQVQINYTLLLLIYFSTLFVYCFHRIYPLQSLGQQALSKRYQWLERNRKLYLAIMSTALVFTIVLTSMMNKIILLWLIPAGLISALYTIPFVRVNGSWWRLRDIGYFKTLLIALTVTFVTVYLPIIDAGNEIIVISMETALICAERFFFIMCITIPFDIRDLKLDEKMGLKTIPSLLGVKKSLALSIVFLAFFVVTFLYHFASTDFMSLAVFMALLASAIVTAFIIIYSTPNRTEYFFSFLVEGTMVIQFLFLLLAY